MDLELEENRINKNGEVKEMKLRESNTQPDFLVGVYELDDETLDEIRKVGDIGVSMDEIFEGKDERWKDAFKKQLEETTIEDIEDDEYGHSVVGEYIFRVARKKAPSNKYRTLGLRGIKVVNGDVLASRANKMSKYLGKKLLPLRGWHNESLEERAATGKVRSALFGDKRRLIKTFAVLTGENPMGKKLSDIENRQRNKRLRKGIENDRRADMEKSGLSQEDFFRRLHVQYIPIQGKFGNDEHSYIVINLSLDDAKKYSELFEQMSFFFGEHTKDDKIIISYYERAREEDDFELIEKTERIDNAQDFDDFFSKYNGLKWSFYLNYFNEGYNFREIINEDFLNKSLDDSYTMMGRALYRRRAYKESYKKRENKLREGCEKLKEAAEQVQVIKYYFPITIELEERSWGWDGDNGIYEITPSQARQYIDNIRDALEKEHTYVTPEKLGEFTGIPKVQSVEFDIGTVHGDVCGIAKVAVLGELTEGEEDKLVDWIEGQNSDGFGEGFEQNPIEVDDGVIYVHFWEPRRNYFIRRI